jgi:hypothetical protein
VSFVFTLIRSQNGTTTDSQSQRDVENDAFLATLTNGTLTAPVDPLKPAKMLSSGHLGSGTQMGSFGSVALALEKTGSLVHRKSCGGKIETYSRAEKATGTFTANPDSPSATPYFGRVSGTAFTGRLLFVVNRNGGRPCKPPKPSCPDVAQLSYTDTTNPSEPWTWAAGSVTLAGTTTYVFLALVFDLSNPRVSAIRVLAITTADGTWFTYQPDLTAAHMDTGVLNVSSLVSGATDYTYDGTAATSQPSTCGGKSFPTVTTNGTLSAPITVTLDGGGTFANAASAAGNLLTSAAASGSRSRSASRSAQALLSRTLRAALR